MSLVDYWIKDRDDDRIADMRSITPTAEQWNGVLDWLEDISGFDLCAVEDALEALQADEDSGKAMRILQHAKDQMDGDS